MPPPDPNQRKILIVDDHPDSARTMMWIVETLGYQAIMAYDGPTALEMARIYHPKFILLDIDLPGMKGYEVCEAMKKEPELREAIFVAQTGWDQPQHAERSKSAGFDHYLVKPIRPEVLQAILAGKNS